MMGRAFIRKLGLAAALLCLLTSCFKNDMPYPYVPGTIADIEVEGALSCEIDVARNTITLQMDETQDLAKVRILSVRFGEEQTWAETAIEGVHDLREPMYVTLGTYDTQRYRWKIVAKQTIVRSMSVSNQIGKTVFDEANRRILLTVSKSVSLTYLNVEAVKLGPRDITTYDKDLTAIHNFTEPIEVTARYHGEDHVWTIYAHTSDKNVVVDRVSPRSRKAWVDASGLAGQRNGVRYRLVGEKKWKEADSLVVEGGSFQAMMDTLQPLTTYEYLAYTGEEETEPETFTTEDEVEVPNGSFEYVTPAGSFYEWYNTAAPLLPEQSAWWGSGNGSKVMGVPGSADMGYVITEPDESSKVSGDRSAKLISKWAVVKFAAGNLFSGYFAGLVGTAGGKVNFGRPFTHRPDSLKCWVKYHSGPVNHIGESCPFPTEMGQNDEAQLFIALGNWDYKKYGGSPECPVQVNTTDMTTKFNPNGEAVIAYGEYTLDHSTVSASGEEVWVEIAVPFVYKDNFTVPTHIVISYASSRLGDYFTGSDQSILWVDDVKLVY
ncbi:MAG: PCMD domain-containing protein [Bacteroidales bacterium]|nr:PCMD domain-containing protein [Bacteroidales bacterium]